MTPEKQVENQIKRKLDASGAYFYKNFGGPHTNKGIPDIVGVYGNDKNSQFFAIEVKRLKGGNPTPVQIRHLSEIAKNGGIALISASDDAMDIIKSVVTHRKITKPVKIVPIHSIRQVSVDKAHAIWHSRLAIAQCQNVLLVYQKNTSATKKR